MYDGNWINDKRNGYGVFSYSEGDIYQGNWIDDKEKDPVHIFIQMVISM